MRESPVLVETREQLRIVRLNRPHVKNAIDLEMVEALHEICRQVEEHPSVVVFIGNGNDFAAGADVTELSKRGREEALQGINSRLFERIHRLPLPTIALVDGYALGGGAELSYACDLRIATTRARFGNPEPALGILAAAGAAWRLKELIGESFASQILLAGEVIDAEKAERSGLVLQVVDPSQLEDAGVALAERIIERSSLAVRLTKSAMHAPPVAHPLVDELTQAILFEHPDTAFRMERFLQRQSGVE